MKPTMIIPMYKSNDNDGNNVGTALDNTNNLLGGQTWKFKAILLGTSGNAISHCDYHEMTSW